LGKKRQWGNKETASPSSAFCWCNPVARYVEYLTLSPYLEEIIVEPFHLDAEGFLTIPAKPGLGIELDLDKLKRYGT
jgi:L-alanine-DL-glutamate epimerase-like enolase superfamily enzyme